MADQNKCSTCETGCENCPEKDNCSKVRGTPTRSWIYRNLYCVSFS